MGYLTPSIVGNDEQDYDVGTGGLTLTFTDTVLAGDTAVLCIETQGGDYASVPSGWTALDAAQTGIGTLHTRALMLGRLMDGGETSVTIADPGNHMSASLFLLRNVDRTLDLSSADVTENTDTTADGNQYSMAVAPGGTTLATGQQFIVVCFTTGGDNHGGSTDSDNTLGLDWYQKLVVRSAGHTQGSDGSHWTRVGRGDEDSTTQQWKMVTVNAMRSAQLAVFFPAHEYTDYTRSVSDGLTSSDSIGRDAGFIRALTDSLGLSDGAGRLAGFSRSMGDALGLADAATRMAGFTRAVSDGLSLGEVVQRIHGYVSSTSDALGLSDALSTSVGNLRGISDSLTFSDVVTRRRLHIVAVAVADSLHLSDIAQRLHGYVLGVNDSLTASDALSIVKGLYRQVVDALTLSDVAARTRGVIRALTDSLNFSDIAQRVHGYITGVADSITFGESLLTQKVLYRLVSDALSLSDLATRARSRIIAVADSLRLSDAITMVSVHGVKAVVTATVRALANIIHTIRTSSDIDVSVAAATDVTTDVNEVGADVDIDMSVEPSTDIEVTIE